MARMIAVLLLVGTPTEDPRYLEDFKFLVDTVQKEYAGFACKPDVDWAAITKRFRPRFEACKSDRDHVLNVMELLATLRDSHTGILETKVDREQLPGKFDGLYGGGLFLGYDAGKWILRGTTPGHPLAKRVPYGSMLLEVDGLPAWFALGKEERRVARFMGLSSDRSFWASLGNRALPFGEKKTIQVKFLPPGAEPRTIEVDRFSPDGRSFDFVGSYLPTGAANAQGAVAFRLPTPWSDKVGYIRITGSQDQATVRAFHSAFDSLKGIEALLLDCRGMGGGSDSCAYEMCGRLFPEPVQNGKAGRLEPSGSWQFKGPVVVLQDEMQVSSAETFAWTLGETRRCVIVGRDTGGWGIIPKRFALPSGLAEFRLGVNLRPTPVTGRIPEERGWPCDVKVPLGPVLATWKEVESDPAPDPAFEIGLIALRTLHILVPLDSVREGFRSLADGDLVSWNSFERRAATQSKELLTDKLGEKFLADLEAEIALEMAALKEQGTPPDWIGLSRRIPELSRRAVGMKIASQAAALEKLLQGAKNEVAAQKELLDLLFDPDPRAFDTPTRRRLWQNRHGRTKTGAWVKAALWK